MKAWDDEEWTLFFRDKSVAWLYGKLYVISKGKTLAEATDAAIGSWCWIHCSCVGIHR